VRRRGPPPPVALCAGDGGRADYDSSARALKKRRPHSRLWRPPARRPSPFRPRPPLFVPTYWRTRTSGPISFCTDICRRLPRPHSSPGRRRHPPCLRCGPAGRSAPHSVRRALIEAAPAPWGHPLFCRALASRRRRPQPSHALADCRDARATARARLLSFFVFIICHRSVRPLPLARGALGATRVPTRASRPAQPRGRGGRRRDPRFARGGARRAE
jgi:hypothetical protein